MAKYAHGTSAPLFEKFSMEHLLEGDGKCKFGVGIYFTENPESALKYAMKSKAGTGCYVYHVMLPEITPTNNISFGEPVHPEILAKTASELGVDVPESVTKDGKLFRKWLAGHFSNPKKPTLDGEKQASAFLSKIGLDFIIWPYSWKKDAVGKFHGPYNVAVLDVNIIRIVNLEIWDRETNTLKQFLTETEFHDLFK